MKDIPAFPFKFYDKYSGDEKFSEGLSIRDCFAMSALQGFCSNPDIDLSNKELNTPDKVGSVLSKWCYSIADAMLENRSRNA